MFLSTLILMLLAFITSVISDCTIEYPSDINTIPKYEKYIGKFKIKIPYGGNSIKIYNGDKLHGFCDTYFSDITYQIKERSTSYNYNYGGYRENIVNKVISEQSSIVFKCKDNKLVLNDINGITQTKFQCITKKWSIYSTKQPYNWCTNNNNSQTFLLTSISSNKHNIVAAVCYNIEQISLQTIVYNTSIIRRNFLDMPTYDRKTDMISVNDLDENLESLKTTRVSDLSEELLQEALTNLRNVDEWLILANYEVSLIVQDKSMENYLKDFKSMFNIIWWRNLRLGNWKRFMKALENHAESNSYELYVGTSGVAQYPTNDKCIKEKLLEMKIGFKNETVPAYIWTYLKSHDNISKDFVILGYNSPYAEYFDLDKVKFCPDICSEIPWLNEIYTTFSHSYAGIMFCCSTDFIRQTNYLEGFPMEILLSRHKTPTNNIPTTTTTDIMSSTIF